ncbi:ribosomal protein S18-alanine N-acetyltransferase [Allocoleopsis franciscana]|uniref:(SSU ribosomal protein S18P)-alanine acetyltransferase n=1 Tax=Allocoleopsis franciscana PCC 7113 TaxID=1173027 RepID=K9WNS8_9CYAN|nr:ribosomal protein S18-alanine N-acetyltransferase [Allocoleopsis franciscana]AFZ21461.1 (SSU ribosomal protein S18P)-alanine acetyltransferase [Allocoleopsis franciscana PCC 7113]
MTFLKLKPLTLEQLSAVVELDQLCFGGLWTRSGYERELESPNSQLLILEAASDQGESGFQKPSSGLGQGVIVIPEIELEGTQVKPDPTQNAQTADLATAPSPPTILIGLGCYWSILEEAHITILAVHPDYQHQGLGQLLLYALLRDAKRRQLEWATLEVKPSNQAALSLYQKFGFIEAGRRRRYYKDTGEDALILWRGGLQKQDFEETLVNCYRQAKQRLHGGGWQMSHLERNREWA